MCSESWVNRACWVMWIILSQYWCVGASWLSYWLIFWRAALFHFCVHEELTFFSTFFNYRHLKTTNNNNMYSPKMWFKSSSVTSVITVFCWFSLMWFQSKINIIIIIILSWGQPICVLPGGPLQWPADIALFSSHDDKALTLDKSPLPHSCLACYLKSLGLSVFIIK